jgi:uncharacterized membrane protein
LRDSWEILKPCRCENRWETDRAEAFSDGAFAIAISLLILDVNVPEAKIDDLWSDNRRRLGRPANPPATS